jgi:hypothetical protein
MSHSVIRRTGVPSSSLGGDRPSASQRLRDAVRLAALALAATAIVAVVCLTLLYVVGGIFGTVNDWANALLGWWVLLVAVLLRLAEGGGWQANAAVGAAAGAVVGLTWGTWLVVTGTTGFFLAGLVSTLGLAAVGAWLLLAHAASRDGGLLATGPARLGRVVGCLMVGGLLALPGALAGVDDFADAQWHSYLAEGSAWLGAYVLLPVWSVRLARRLRRA